MTVNSVYSRPLLVSFSGIDGAGKSTQITRLKTALQTAGLRVNIITFWDDVVTLKSFRENMGHKVFRGDKGVGSPDAPIQRRDKNVQSHAVNLARMVFYLLDVIALRRVIRRACSEKPETRADVIIFDRFIYDELANLNAASLIMGAYQSAMLHLVPRPDLPFVLDADPDAAFARKPEYPLEFLRSNRKAYLDLAGKAGMTVIAPAPMDDAHQEILGHVQRKSHALRAGSPAAGRNVNQNEFAV